MLDTPGATLEAEPAEFIEHRREEDEVADPTIRRNL